MNRDEFVQHLQRLGACYAALDWIGDRNSDEAWNNCPHGPWMSWLIRAISDRDSAAWRALVGVEAELVKRDLLLYRSYGRDDRRLHRTLDAARRFAHGEGTWGQLRTVAEDLKSAGLLADSAVPDVIEVATARIGHGNEGGFSCTMQLIAAAHARCFGERRRADITRCGALLLRERFPVCPLDDPLPRSTP